MTPMAEVGLSAADGFRFTMGSMFAQDVYSLLALVALVCVAVILFEVCAAFISDDKPPQSPQDPTPPQKLNGTWDVLFKTGNKKQ